MQKIQEKISELPPNDTESYFAIMTESIAANRTEFYINNGGLFFLGLLLGIVFLFAAVLIMYYKQISEGYEDQSRFGIMQKVGMTKKRNQKEHQLAGLNGVLFAADCRWTAFNFCVSHDLKALSTVWPHQYQAIDFSDCLMLSGFCFVLYPGLPDYLQSVLFYRERSKRRKLKEA